MNHNPCYKCNDRYPACSSTCEKPEYIAECIFKDKVRAGRKADADAREATNSSGLRHVKPPIIGKCKYNVRE